MGFQRSLTAVGVLLAVAMTFAGQAHAQAKGGKKGGLVDQVSGNGYGMAGCGLGSILFGAKPGKIQIIAATTNGIYGNQSFGITSGTSNCDIPEMGQQAAAFIETNREIVMKEAARGEGETVTALSVLLNCNESALSKDMKANFNHYFGQDVGAYESVRRMINSGTCAVEG